MSHALVIGAGPVGSTITRQLTDAGRTVTVMTRSGSGPNHPNVTLRRGDASSAAEVLAAATGCSTIFNCVNPPYTRWPQDWPPIHRATMQAAETSGAALVLMDNLYALGPDTPMPMREDSPMRATGRKGATRRQMAEELLAAHETGRLRAVVVRASDFFGPGVRDAGFGERLVPRVIAGKSVSLLGNPDARHSLSYMPDVAATMIAAADDESVWGTVVQVPNAPAVTQRQFVTALADAAGTNVRIRRIPLGLLKALGLVVPMMRELTETYYQFDEEWTTDSTVTEQALHVSATPLERAAQATVAWWQQANTPEGGGRARSKGAPTTVAR